MPKEQPQYNSARELTQLKYRDIMREYRRLSGVREHGVQKFTLDFILEKLRLRFYMATRSIYYVVLNEPADGYLNDIAKNNPKNQGKLDL